MIMDAQQLLSDAQAVSGAATTVSTNTIDLLAATNDVSVGEPLVIAVSVDVAADAGNGDETYAFEAITSAAANLGSPTVLSRITIARATLVAGYIFVIPIPQGSIAQRYLGLQYVLGGTTPSITCTAWVTTTQMLQRNKVFPKGYTISG